MSTPRKCEHLGKLPIPLGDTPGIEFEGKMLVLGGGSGGEVSDRIFAIDPVTGKCEQLGQMPYASRGHQVVALHGAIYLLGGFDGRGTTKSDFWRIALKSGAAERLPDMPSGNAWFSATVHQGRIVVVGGFNIPGGYLDHIATYDLQIKQWSVMNRAFDPTIFGRGKLGGSTALSNGDRLVSFGGADLFDPQTKRANALPIVGSFDLVTRSWTRATNLEPPREGLVGAVHGRRGYLVGGMPEGVEEPSKMIEEVELDTMEVHPIAEMSMGRLTPAVAIVGHRLIVAGGVVQPVTQMTDTIEYLDLDVSA